MPLNTKRTTQKVVFWNMPPGNTTDPNILQMSARDGSIRLNLIKQTFQQDIATPADKLKHLQNV